MEAANPRHISLLGLVEDDAIVLLLEPLHSLLAGHLVLVAESASLGLSLGHTATGTSQLHVEIHTEDTGVRVVLDAQINVLLNTEAEVAGVGEVLLHELVLLHLQTALQNLQGLLAANGGMDGDLLVTADGERTDGETGYRIRGLGLQMNEPFPYTGSWPEICCSTRAALEIASPDSPTQMLMTSFSTRMLRMGLAFSLYSR